MFQVKVTNSMFIAHSLPDESFGPAQNLHGATYTIDLFISSSTLTDKNIVIDIDIASKILSEIVKKYNYKNLDDLDEFKGILTTTEFMAQQIVNHFIEIAKNNSIDISKLFSIKVTLNESHIAAASYEKNLNE